MVKYIIELTDVEDKAFQYVAYSVKDWISNAAQNRARQAIDELYKQETDRMLKDPNIKSIPADKDEVIVNCKEPTTKEKKIMHEKKMLEM